jgi:hypothetical protein
MKFPLVWCRHLKGVSIFRKKLKEPWRERENDGVHKKEIEGECDQEMAVFIVSICGNRVVNDSQKTFKIEAFWIAFSQKLAQDCGNCIHSVGVSRSWRARIGCKLVRLEIAFCFQRE